MILTKDGQILTTDGSASGKEVVEIDSSIIELDEQNKIVEFNFYNIELNNTYIVIDLMEYQQSLENRVNNVLFDFYGSNITNSTILIKKPYIANENLSVECIFENSGIFLNGENESPNWNYYTHYIYEKDFSFSFPFTTECFLKIDFDEVGSVEVKYSSQNDI